MPTVGWIYEGGLGRVLSATAAAHGLTVAMTNERHFRDTGVPWVNPLSGALDVGGADA